MTCTLSVSVHVCHSYASYEQSSYLVILHEVINKVEQIYCSQEKKGSRPNPQHADWPIHGCIPRFSPTIAIEAVEKSQACIDNKLHRFTELISSACDQYVQYLLMGVNSSVLNRHRQGLQPCRCRFSTSYSPPFPFGGPPLFPNGPSGLRLIIST
jgi:hypothetical protein